MAFLGRFLGYFLLISVVSLLIGFVCAIMAAVITKMGVWAIPVCIMMFIVMLSAILAGTDV